MNNNGHFSFCQPKIIIPSLTTGSSEMPSILFGQTLHLHLQYPGVGTYLLSGGFPPPLFSLAHHETNVQRQGFVANVVYKKCSPQNYMRGWVWVGQKWGGWVQSWVGGSCPKQPPPSYKRSLTWMGHHDQKTYPS